MWPSRRLVTTLEEVGWGEDSGSRLQGGRGLCPRWAGETEAIGNGEEGKVVVIPSRHSAAA